MEPGAKTRIRKRPAAAGNEGVEMDRIDVVIALEIRTEFAEVPTLCSDRDSDCRHITDKLGCYVFDPQKGRCPYLRLPEGAE
jgi:hypothetical protein